MMSDSSVIAKTLASIVTQINSEDAVAELMVSDIHTDSRDVAPGSMFVALRGIHVNGEDYISHAVEKGAVVILVENQNLHAIIDVEVPVIGIQNLKHELADICTKFFGDASSAMTVVGVTGTNGKSTITSLVAQLAQLFGVKSGIVGTLGYGFVDKVAVETGMTTPSLVNCHRICAQLYEQGAELVAMEVSSHGIDQNRVANVSFDIAVISNITRDHLDYHGSFQAYSDTKRGFILSESSEAAVVNLDDPECEVLVSALEKLNKKFLTYSTYDTNADLWACITAYRPNATEISITYDKQNFVVSCPLVGEFNLSNLLAALGALLLKGYPFDEFASYIPSLHPIAGRLERVDLDTQERVPEVFIDYAHTTDALAQVLSAIKKHVKGRLWVVFGCGGDRDRGKRAEMGAVAADLADRIIVTSDNPRSESPDQIINDIVAGIDTNSVFDSVEDRRAAIFLAICHAEPQDTVLIAGKGHENYQMIGKRKLPFQDYLVAKEALLERLSLSGGQV